MKDEDAAARRRNHWVNHIARHAHAQPDGVYVRFEGRSITWSQLEHRVTAVAAAMARRGVAATLELMASERVTSMFLVPAQWQLLCSDPPRPAHDLSALRTVSWGAAPATTTLLTKMAQVFSGVTNVAVFGQTEMSPATCALDGADALRKIGSVGRPVATVSARIVDDDMTDVPPGEVGEIVYRGPTAMSGYWRNPEATAEAFRGGWFHSGDLVRADAEGFLYVVDRKKDMIITGGENVYCAEVENALAAHPAVVELAVIGTPDERWGETPAAIAVLRPGASLTLAELRDWAEGRIARYKLPTVLHVVPTLPRNASGKVTKTALRDQFGPAPVSPGGGGGEATRQADRGRVELPGGQV